MKPFLLAAVVWSMVAGGAASAATLTDTLIPSGALWKYLDNGSAPDPAWRTLFFNDAPWRRGAARLGYGGDGEVTTVSFGPNSGAKYLITYFRHGFEVSDISVYRSLKLRVVRDDGAIVYLNGSEMFRSNIPASIAVAGGEEFIFFETNVPPALLRAGSNIVAAEIHQSSGTSSDLGFDLELTGEISGVPASVALSAVRTGPNQVSVAWPRPAVGFVLQTTTQPLASNSWSAVTNAVAIDRTNDAVLRNTGRSYEAFRLRRQPVDASTLARKLMFGYQGWFACTNDGGPPNRWVHWFRSQVPAATNATVDFWPDISESDPDELFATAMTLPNGQPARLYGACRPKTVLRHFRWMHEAGVDGVFLQRFTSELGDRSFFEWRNQVAYNVRAGAEAYGRIFAMMYDISGQNSNTLVTALQNDWTYLTGTLRLTNSARYVRHRGRPVVAIWGLGFSDRPGTAAQAQQIVDWFKAAGCTVLGGVPTSWRTLGGDSQTDPAWAAVYRSFDIISPWSVGRYSTDAGADSFRATRIAPDLVEATANGRDYMPVIWPGFSWHNLNGGALNQIPRRGGRFWWRQFYNAASAGCTMIYGAMFDEVDEGTAMYRLAPTSAQLPAQGTFVPLNIDGEALPSDWYLRLAGEAGRMLRGETPLLPTRPINP